MYTLSYPTSNIDSCAWMSKFLSQQSHGKSRLYNYRYIPDTTRIHNCIQYQKQGAQWIYLRAINQENVWTQLGRTNHTLCPGQTPVNLWIPPINNPPGIMDTQ